MNNTTNKQTVEELSTLLASSYSLYLKTHNYHWNVTGPMFTTLHTLFETQYTELAMAIDEIAERIRAKGEFAIGSFSAFSAISKVDEENGRPNAAAMINALIADQEALVLVSKALISASEEEGDHVSVDLAVRRSEVHEKNAWMLRSHLG